MGRGFEREFDGDEMKAEIPKVDFSGHFRAVEKILWATRTRPGFAHGWLKRQPTIIRRNDGSFDCEIEYWMDEWPTDLFEIDHDCHNPAPKL